MTTSPLVVGLMGIKQSGKDTLADHLVSNFGFTRFALADTIRDFALALDPIIGLDETHDGAMFSVRLSDYIGQHGWEVAKEASPEVRRTLQRLGVEAGRGVFGENVWIEATVRRIRKVDGPIVVTDIRFQNEYEWIRRNEGQLVRVFRPDTVAGDHSSEAMAQDLVGFPADLNAYNTGTLLQFVDQCGHLGRRLTDPR